MADVINWIVQTVGDLGYIGIFIMMFIESTVFPLPSEIVMIPAGFLASKGEMNIFVAIFSGITGSLGGALFNYYFALKYGRNFLAKYGKYILFKEESLERVENFFALHGHIATFSGRLIPAVRHYISIPAGLARMNLLKFSIYTSLGAGIWVSILALLGYFIGENKAILDMYLPKIIIIMLVVLLIFILFYIRLQVKKGVIKRKTKK